MSNIIDENGIQLHWTAVYDRYHSRHIEECDSLAEARAFLRNGEEYGELSSVHILSPDGEVIEYDYVNDSDEVATPTAPGDKR